MINPGNAPCVYYNLPDESGTVIVGRYQNSGLYVGHLISNSEPCGTQIVFSTELLLIPHRLDEFYKLVLCSHKTKLNIGKHAIM